MEESTGVVSWGLPGCGSRRRSPVGGRRAAQRRSERDGVRDCWRAERASRASGRRGTGRRSEGLRGTAGGLPEGGAGEQGERRARVRDRGLRERERETETQRECAAAGG